MINNTRDLVRALKLWASGVVLLTVGLAGFAVNRGIRSLKRYSRSFDPDNLEDVTGTVLEVLKTRDNSYDTRGIILLLDVEDEILEVHVGPTWFVERQIRAFKTGEELRVTGSVVPYHGEDVLVVQNITRGKKTYRFRQDDGSPYWESRVR